MENSNVEIIKLIPKGHRNAISREKLVRVCGFCGIVDESKPDADRQVRRLISKAREKDVILTGEDGGYFVPDIHDPVDMDLLGKFCKQEKKRALTILKSAKLANKMYADFQRGRFITGFFI